MENKVNVSGKGGNVRNSVVKAGNHFPDMAVAVRQDDEVKKRGVD